MKFPKKNIKFLLILQICICIAGCSQIFGQYRFDTWNTDKGLPQNGVRQITQTADGYLWFTTFDGLVRFDGVRFTTFNKANTKGIINNRFTGLFGDKDGTLYATTMEDGILTIYRNGVFTSLTSDQIPGHYIQKIEPGETGELRFLVEDEARTSKSWYYFRQEKFVFSETIPQIKEKYTVQGRLGTQWTITPTEVIEARDGQITTYRLDLSKITYRANAFADRKGNLWIGEYRIHRLNNGKIETFSEKEGFPLNSIYHSFWEESDGSVWFASGGGSSRSVGLVQYQNGKFSFWGSEYGLAQTPIQDIFRDREGTTWLATNKGLSRLRKKVISGFSVKDGIANSEVYPILRDSKGDIWIGTAKGLSIYRNGKFAPLELKSTHQNEKWIPEKTSVQSLFEDSKGKMWIGINGGLFIAQNGKAEFLENTKGTHIFAIQSDRAGNVWAATNKGLLQYRDDKLITSYSTAEGLPNEFMTFIFNDSKGGLWFGGLGGLSEFKDGKFINYTAKEGLVGNYVRTIYEDSEGTFWIGTYDEGMSRFKDGNFVSFKEENGLYNSGVFAIEEDEKGNFWISSNRGIYRVNRQELNDFADGKIKKINSVGYGKEDGMLSTECNGGRQPASFKDDEGNFWFPTQNGIAIVNPKAEIYNPLPPSVIIESATVEREPIDLQNGINVEPGKRNIEITFTGINLIKSEQIKFKYKLEGYDKDWIDAGTRRTAYYSHLPPGNYAFKVIAANSEGIWNEEGASISLKLQPYFYQTVWFYLLCAVAGIFGLFAIWKISVYQLKLRERKLTKLVAKRTAELNKANEELQQLANSDGLTGVGNRRRFEEFLASEWQRSARLKTEISLILIDIDHFKLFNDTYGHQAGDDCLRKVAFALAETIKRPSDLVARFGGEEFAIILGGTDAEGALIIAEQAVENIRNLKIPHSKSETSSHLTVSIGMSTTFVRFEMSEADIIKAADKALYQAKENGRNRIHTFDFLTQKSNNKSVLDEEFININ